MKPSGNVTVLPFGWPGQLVVRVAAGHRKLLQKSIQYVVVNVPRLIASCALRASGQQVARTTQIGYTEVIVLGEEH